MLLASYSFYMQSGVFNWVFNWYATGMQLECNWFASGMQSGGETQGHSCKKPALFCFGFPVFGPLWGQTMKRSKTYTQGESAEGGL